MENNILTHKQYLKIITAGVIISALALGITESITIKGGFVWQDFVRHVALEVVRAFVLVVNVEILRTAKGGSKKNYYVILIVSIMVALIVGLAITMNHGMNVYSSNFWTAQALNIMILSSELSLSFLLAGKGKNFEDMEAELTAANEQVKAANEQVKASEKQIEALGQQIKEERKQLKAEVQQEKARSDQANEKLDELASAVESMKAIEMHKNSRRYRIATDGKQLTYVQIKNGQVIDMPEGYKLWSNDKIVSIAV